MIRTHAITIICTILLTACNAPTLQPSIPIENTAKITLNDGTPSSLETLRNNRPALLSFWASWCSFCQAELPELNALQSQYPTIEFIGINLQEEADTVATFWEKQELSFQNLLDPKAELKKEFNIFTQPTLILLDADGNTAWRSNGPVRKKDLTTQLNAITSTPKIEEITQSNDQTSQISPTPSFLRRWYSKEHSIDTVRHSIPLTQVLNGGPGKDGIPSIDNPQFVGIEEVTFLNDDSVGILLNVEGNTRFYPYAILNWHEIVNDTVAGIPVAVTYCPLCATGVVFDRRLSVGTSKIGVSGFLYQSNLLMYDRSTESLWNQVSGRAVVGELTDEVLNWVPSDTVRFATVKQQYHHAQILSTDTGERRNYTDSPYGNYDTNERIYFPVEHSDDRLHPKALVYGVIIDGHAKAYPATLLREQTKLTDTVGSKKLRITYNPETENLTIVDQTNQRIDTLPIFWFAWVAQYPETGLYGE